ncbi:hypothetical protein ACFOZ0_33840 [Streptomyces yaanensis]|uniref:Uncharacterized protein n=1 Tax=Streptomyces yaanensis TaxID=1142239 RepID=A0ABV7SN59_9ACTN|nr:hypothetical protein [Streptomyces sp. CGMCC 4.7035]WNB98140.1 hypothetical protein Q2K21_08650 [Streptomyces sp. CGMCC 4.7035]
MTEDSVASPLRLFIDDSARDPSSKIWYALPGGYLNVPLDALDAAPGTEHEARLEHLMALVADSAPEAERDRFAGTVRDVRYMVREMHSEGIIGCALGMHYADDGSSAVSVVTVALRDIEWAPPKVTAVRAATLRESAENVELVTLPGGLSGAVSDSLLTVPAVAGMPIQELYQCNVYIPAPSGVQLAVLTLSTVAVDSRKHYRDLMLAIAYTVSFHDPMRDIERAARGEEADGPGSIANGIAADFG